MIWGKIALNLIFALAIAPLLDGVERKLKARFQRRKGPSIFQTWWDLIKLFKREGVIPEGSTKEIFKIAPALSFSAVLAGFLLIPTLFGESLESFGDMIVLIYLLTLSLFSLSLGAFSSGNPYAQLGSERELSLFMGEELALALIIGAMAVQKEGFSITKLFPLDLKPSSFLIFVCLGVIGYFSGMRVPFDIPEAEPEIVEGALIEYSGRDLALLKYSIYLKRLLLASLLLDLFLPKEGRFLFYIIGLLAISFLYSGIEAHYGRVRVKEALPFLKGLSVVSFIAWALAMAGW